MRSLVRVPAILLLLAAAPSLAVSADAGATGASAQPSAKQTARFNAEFTRGRKLSAQKRWVDAIRAFEAALQLVPMSQQALTDLGTAAKGLASGLSAVNTQATKEITDKSCAELLATPSAVISGYGAVAADFKKMAAALSAGDKAAYQSATTALTTSLDEMKKLTANSELGKPATQQISDFKKSCKPS